MTGVAAPVRVGPAPLDPRAAQVMVPMRDGVRLATDVYLPEAGAGVQRHGRFPVILVRLPYDKSGRETFMPALAPCFTERGYAFVAQDVRGKFRSEGETFPYVRELEDGYDTVEWVASQLWSDGRVGMFGDSYYGFTQWAAVASGHPALRAIAPRVTTVDLGTVRLGTSWENTVPKLYSASYQAHYFVEAATYEYEPDWERRPLAEAFDDAFAAIGRRSAAFDVLLALARERTTFETFAPPARHPFQRLRIPVLHTTGWFDNLGPWAMRDYLTLSRDPQRSDLQHLFVDAMDHESYRLADVPVTPATDHYVSDEALARLLPDYAGPALDFFDVVIKGRRSTAGIARVRWRLGHESWHEAPCWPPPGAREVLLYLGAAAQAASGPAGGTLRPQAEPLAAATPWIHDPQDLVPSSVHDPFGFVREYPDEREVEGRGDVLTFTGEPVAAPLDLAGPVTAVLGVGTSGPSMDLHVKLVDVAPDGAAHTIVGGQARACGPDPARPTVVELSHTGYRLGAGHALRLHVASSDFPLYLWHPGTDENPWEATRCVANEQTLTTGGGAPSHVRLSVWDGPGARGDGQRGS